MRVKVYAYKLAIEKLTKELVKVEKKIDELSTKMETMLEDDISARKRASMRTGLTIYCESAERYRRDIEQLHKLVDEEKLFLQN